jgi:flagellar assembly protein FliH
MSRGSEFVPLGGGSPPPGASFTPFGTPAQGPQPVEEDPAAEEMRRAFRAGYERAREEMATEGETVAASFVKAVQELGAFRARLRDRYERELLEVALGVAKKVVQQELTARPEIWLGMLRAGIRRTVEREHIVVRVPAPLAEFLRERTPELRAALEDVKELAVVDDPALPPGGCLVESRFGDVDLGVDTQIEAARAALVSAEE